MAFDGIADGLPLWLNPVQIRLLPVSDKFVEACEKLANELSDLPLRIEIDDRNISVAAKLKSAAADYVPHKVVIGQQELDNSLEEIKALALKLADEVKGLPYIPREWPAQLGKQVN